MNDETARILELIAETFDSNAQIMNAAAKAARGDGLTRESRLDGGGRSLLADHAEGCRDAFRIARDFCQEIAVAPPESRGQIAARLRLVSDDIVDGHQLQEHTRA